jgi:hypothetical protein
MLLALLAVTPMVPPPVGRKIACWLTVPVPHKRPALLSHTEGSSEFLCEVGFQIEHAVLEELF